MKHTVKEVTLKNGARGLLINVPDATVMQYKIHFRAGNRHVKSKLIYETAHLMEHMSFGANSKFASEQDYAAEFSKNGARNNAYTSDLAMVYLGVCADFEWDRILDLQRLAICEPRFRQSKLEAEKGNVRNELNGMLSEHSNLLWYRMQQLLGEDILNLNQRIKTIDNIKLEDIVEHHTKTHTLNNMRFIIAGKLTNRERKIKQALNGWSLSTGKRLAIPHDESKSSGPVLIKQKNGKSLTFGFSLVLGRVLTARECTAMVALNHILTATTFSRIFGKARERGLVYNIFSDFENRHYDSCWDFAGQVMPETAEELFDLIIKELLAVVDGRITDQEIESAKSYGLGSYQMGSQTVGQMVNFYEHTYFKQDEIKNYQTVPNYIRKITKKDVINVAYEFMTKGKWALVGVGNVNEDLLQSLNDKLRIALANEKNV